MKPSSQCLLIISDNLLTTLTLSSQELVDGSDMLWLLFTSSLSNTTSENKSVTPWVTDMKSLMPFKFWSILLERLEIQVEILPMQKLQHSRITKMNQSRKDKIGLLVLMTQTLLVKQLLQHHELGVPIEHPTYFEN